MKRIICSTLIMVVVIVLSACAKETLQSNDEMINPGDKVGDFLITKGGSEDIHWEFNWEKQSSNAELYSGTINTDIKLNVSWGVYDGSNSGTLDELWSGHTYKMFINDRPVNLEAFGSIDVVHPAVGTMRYWNVVIIADKPSEITVRSEGVVNGEPFGDTKIITFIKP